MGQVLSFGSRFIFHALFSFLRYNKYIDAFYQKSVILQKEKAMVRKYKAWIIGVVALLAVVVGLAFALRPKPQPVADGTGKLHGTS